MENWQIIWQGIAVKNRRDRFLIPSHNLSFYSCLLSLYISEYESPVTLDICRGPTPSSFITSPTISFFRSLDSVRKSVMLIAPPLPKVNQRTTSSEIILRSLNSKHPVLSGKGMSTQADNSAIPYLLTTVSVWHTFTTDLWR